MKEIFVNKDNYFNHSLNKLYGTGYAWNEIPSFHCPID